MSERVDVYVCRCGQSVTVLTTRNGKRIGVNREPKGHSAFRFRDVARLETVFDPSRNDAQGVYIAGHQPHRMTCTNPRPPKEVRRYIR